MKKPFYIVTESLILRETSEKRKIRRFTTREEAERAIASIKADSEEWPFAGQIGYQVRKIGPDDGELLKRR